MAFKMEFSTANAAFEENLEHEVFRIVDDVAQEVIDGSRSGKIRDINGNTVGEWSLTSEDED